MSDIVERLRIAAKQIVTDGPVMYAAKTALRLLPEAADEITRLTAENEKLKAGLRECELELNAYYRMKYPGDHPYSQQELAQAIASNPATVALKEKP